MTKKEALQITEPHKLPLKEWMWYMYWIYKIKFFGLKPRGGKQTFLNPKTVHFLYHKGKKTTAYALGWWQFGYGDYEFIDYGERG